MVRVARPRDDSQDVRRHERIVGSVSDFPPAHYRGPALLDREPDVRDGRATGGRRVSDARVAAGIFRRPACAGPARADARREHRRSARRGLTDEFERDSAPARREGRRQRAPARTLTAVAARVLWDLTRGGLRSLRAKSPRLSNCLSRGRLLPAAASWERPAAICEQIAAG